MNFQSLVELAPWTTIAQICNLLIQIVLFKKFLFQPIKNIIAKRQAEVDGLYDEAGKAKADAEEAKAAYETHLKTASEEAKAITTPRYLVRQPCQRADRLHREGGGRRDARKCQPRN